MIVQVTFNSTIEQYNWIHDEVGKGNISKWMREAVDEKRKREGWKPEKVEEEP